MQNVFDIPVERITIKVITEVLRKNVQIFVYTVNEEIVIINDLHKDP
jgi:hypothetical protein